MLSESARYDSDHSESAYMLNPTNNITYMQNYTVPSGSM